MRTLHTNEIQVISGGMDPAADGLMFLLGLGAVGYTLVESFCAAATLAIGLGIGAGFLVGIGVTAATMGTYRYFS